LIVSSDIRQPVNRENELPNQIQTHFDFQMSRLKMNTRRFLFLLLISIFLGIFSQVKQTAAATGVHVIWAELLSKYVRAGGVDYTGFKSDENRLDQYLKVLEQTDSKTLPRKEQFAYYVNAYNAWTIKLILSAYPGVTSIKDLGTFWQSPWQKKFVRIDGDVITLDDIEHQILRPRFKDPRVHFAINCSAVSCPPLRSEPYLGNSLDLQLDQATRSFLNNPNNYRLKDHAFYVSRIFKWFAEDFSNDVLKFYLKFAQDDLKKKLAEKKDVIQIKFLNYDWSLNDITSRQGG
jgi:hypothetical protein